jgi:manganese/zinc/iron transport system permease protein
MSALFNNIPFVIMATGALVGVAASLLGTFLVLRKNSMLADAISHSIIFGIAVVWIMTRQQSGVLQIIGAALTGLLTVWLSELLAQTRKVKDDAAIGLVFPALFALGVLLINLYAGNVHIDQHTVLLGEIGFVWLDTIRIWGVNVPDALLWMTVMTLVNTAFVGLFYKELKLITFDRALAHALGFMPGVLFYALLLLTSTTAVAAFDAVGAVLFIAFVIVPPSAAYLLTDRLWKMLLYASLISVASSILGYYAALAWDVSIGGMMALMTGGFLLLAFLFSPNYGLIAQEIRRTSQRANNENRALAVHLYNHQGSPVQFEENVVQALREHLRWDDQKAQQVVLRGLDQKLITKDANLLKLTAKGQAVAKEVLEPLAR